VDWNATGLEITIIYPAIKYISGDSVIIIELRNIWATLKPSNAPISVPYHARADCTNVDNSLKYFI
jgi:hypothetical protein